MSIQLVFSSPKELDTLKSARPVEKKPWHYGNESESTLELDTDTWHITCPQNQKTAVITEWMVDESSFSFKLKEDEASGNYSPVDYSFAIAMVGQLCPPGLIAQYIGQLLAVFNMCPSKGEESQEDNGRPPVTPEQNNE